MDAFLELTADQRAIRCEKVGDELGMPPGAVEKDFWVCWVLRALYRLNVGPHLAFKGGTSLSKCYGMIDRFSEDIDLVIERAFLGFDGDNAPENAPSGKERARRIDRLKAACREYIATTLFPELRAIVQQQSGEANVKSLTIDPDDPDQQTILFPYEPVLKGPAYVRPVVKIELGARSDTEPNESRFVEPYLAQVPNHGLGDCRVQVKVVAAERTFWEKVSLLHEESFREGPPRSRLARHYYDLWCLDRQGIADRAIQMGSLFEDVAEHRRIYFKLGGVAQAQLRRGSVTLLPTEAKLPMWESDYRAMLDTMFIGQPPTFTAIMTALRSLESRINLSA